MVENTVFLFEEKPMDCPFHLVHGIQVEHTWEGVVMDCPLSLNLTMPRRINSQGCHVMTIFSTRLPGVEIKYCVWSAPLILCGALRFADLDSLVTTQHPEVVSCHENFLMLLETTKKLWDTVNKRIRQIEAPGKLCDRVSKVTKAIVTTLNTHDELRGCKDFNRFPAYMKSSHQELLNSFCVK